MNRIIFKGCRIKNTKSLRIGIINLVKYWCHMNKDNSFLKTQLVLSCDVEGLPL